MSSALTPFKTKFLLAALPDVPFDGWTDELLRRAAERLKVSKTKVDMEFPRGAADLATCLFLWATDETLKKLARRDMAKLRVRERIALGVRTRLEILAPHKEAVRSALTFLASPRQGLPLPKLVWRAADRLWWAAGDTATDYNHYTKRLLLSGVISATTLCWLNDTSPHHAKTWAFLDRRIDNVLKIGMTLGKLKKKEPA
ncbi:MAG: COQ9 family protein [Alphaproteobacteria bacterium]|nr:COQ9 family protein [Alphaproteobacteria bacterium]MDE2336408.1 COQ9 family protein [Alphaproteobacteria bacterium]